MASVWRIELSVQGVDGSTHERAAEIVTALNRQREVEGSGPTWTTTVLDLAFRPAAVGVLARELDELAPDWRDVLTLG